MLCVMQTLYLVHIFLTNTSCMQPDLATNLRRENWEDSRCWALQVETELRGELCEPRREQTTSPWGCRGRCFPGCLRLGENTVYWTSHSVTGMDILQGTLGVICTSIPHKQNPWVLPLSQSRKVDCPRQEKLIYPCHQTSWGSSTHFVISLKLAGLQHRRICWEHLCLLLHGFCLW